MRVLNWHPEDKIPELRKAGMERLAAAAEVVKMNAILKLRSMIEETYQQHGPYKKNASFWTARHYTAMAHTIRVVRSKDPKARSIWIMAGNKKTWWAKQMEYGNGDWKGGRKSFLRPALIGSMSQIKMVLESGNAETKGSEGYD